MERKAYFVFSFENYLEAVNFNESLPKERIAYQLFYVTQVARLRKDMTPHIISDRLNDQIRILNEKYDKGKSYYNMELTSPAAVKEIMDKTPEYFAVSTYIDKATDRGGYQQPYVLTENKKNELKDKLHYYWEKKIVKQSLYDKRCTQLLICLIIFMGLSIMAFQINNSNKLGISWLEYQEKVEWENIDNYNRSIYILHYITKVIKFNDDMTPQVLSDRLVSLNCPFTVPDSINSFLLHDDRVKTSNKRKNAFMISPEGERVIAKKAGIVSAYEYDGNVDLVWLWKNRPDIYWATLALFITVGSVIFRSAYNIGKKVNLLYKDEENNLELAN